MIQVLPFVLYGEFVVPPPVLLAAGFTIIGKKDDFTKARRDGKDYFIQRSHGGRLHLWQCRYDGQKTERNPLGEFADVGAGPLVFSETEEA